jgi:hypothetical protein
MISYDLKTKFKNYNNLFEELKRSPKWWHYLDSTWLVTSHETAAQIYERLRHHIFVNDRLIVIEVKGNYMGWLPQKAWEWIAENISS